MGEYAKRKSDGARIKIGTCEEMYIRYEDRDKFQKIDHNVDPATVTNCHWRLPLPAEDNVLPGDYESEGVYPMPGFQREMDFSDGDWNAGIIQLHHPMGLVVNLPCYHSVKEPVVTGDDGVQAFFNGHDPHAFVLCAVKDTKAEGMMAIVGCKFCRSKWRMPMETVLPYVKDKELQRRLQDYNKPEPEPEHVVQTPKKTKKANPKGSLDWSDMF